jgi:hypothetical protein
VLQIDQPAVRVRYERREQAPGALEAEVRRVLGHVPALDSLVTASIARDADQRSGVFSNTGRVGKRRRSARLSFNAS